MAKQRSVFDTEVAKKMEEIKRKKIWQRARAILKRFNCEHISERNCYSVHRGVFSEVFPEGKLEIRISSYGQFHENLDLQIKFQGRVVFEAEESAWHEKYDRRRVMKIRGARVVIQKFSSGNWTNLLSVKKIERLLNPKPPKKAQNLSKPEKVKEHDEELAARFGVWDPAG